MTETEYSRYASTPEGAIELAGAVATAQVSRLFRKFAALAFRRQSQIAEWLNVSEGRVSQVLNGDGNVTVAALAKYARAYGYTLTFTLTPAEREAPELNAEPTARRRRAAPHNSDTTTPPTGGASNMLVDHYKFGGFRVGSSLPGGSVFITGHNFLLVDPEKTTGASVVRIEMEGRSAE